MIEVWLDWGWLNFRKSICQGRGQRSRGQGKILNSCLVIIPSLMTISLKLQVYYGHGWLDADENDESPDETPSTSGMKSPTTSSATPSTPAHQKSSRGEWPSGEDISVSVLLTLILFQFLTLFLRMDSSPNSQFCWPLASRNCEII